MHRAAVPTLSTALRSGEALNNTESIRGPGPVTFDGLRSGPAGHRAQRERNADDVIGVADHRNEVRDQIQRRDQVRDQEQQPDTDTAGQAAVSGQTAQQPHQIREQAHASRSWAVLGGRGGAHATAAPALPGTTQRRRRRG